MTKDAAEDALRERVTQAYEEVPYATHVHPETHPAHLAAMARINGFDTPAVETCRVLDIGCARGANVAAMAVTLPRARFVGFDVSPRQIEAARAMIAGAKIANVEVRVGDIVELAANGELGQFDYVIAHGIHSWVPPLVGDALFALAARSLAPRGLFYASFNTLPAWHARTMLRDVLLYRIRGVEGAAERVRRAREAMKWLGECLPNGGPYGELLTAPMKLLEKTPDEDFLHDDLGTVHHPVYLHELVERAEAHGFKYLDDASPQTTATHGTMPQAPQARAAVPEGDRVGAEQIFDFLVNRNFRRAIFCRKDIELARAPDPHVVASLRIATRAYPAATLSLGAIRDVSEVTFRTTTGGVTTVQPHFKAALAHLVAVAPRAASLSEMVAGARQLLERPLSSTETEQLELFVLRAFLTTTGVCDLQTVDPPCVVDLSPRPVASPAARWEAAHGRRVVNLRLYPVALQPPVRHFLTLVDGTRDHAALGAALQEMVDSGELVLEGGKKEKLKPAATEEALRQLARAALLVG